MVGATSNSSNRTTSNSLDRPTGHYLRLEAGFPNFFTVAYGYQINPWFMVGGGGGFGFITYHYHEAHTSYYDEWMGLGTPLFAELIYNTPKQQTSFFIDLKLGANIAYDYEYENWHTDGSCDYNKSRKFYSSLNLGAGFGNFGVFGGISTNSAHLWFSAGLSYNIPLKVH